MKIVLVNPPHTAIGSRMPGEHLPPLGLLAIGGPLLDDGHAVRLLDADLRELSLAAITDEVFSNAPQMVMIGHSGSSTAHGTILALCRTLKAQLPELLIVYGGVHPTYHWQGIMADCHDIDIIVRGEGEKTVQALVRCIEAGEALHIIPGIVFREGGHIQTTEAAAVQEDLDQFRIGWELISHRDYSYWGGKRAVVVQFSRGCPYQCSYCGQRGFWSKWRHRDPQRFAKELARLYREEGVELINFADELPTGSRVAWQALLEALIAEDVPLILVGSTRAGDIVRDKDILHLYKQAGVIRLLLGIETYSDAVIAEIRKGGCVAEDREAIRLLRQHGIISMATYVVGLSEEKDADYWQSYRHLLSYDPDQVQLLYATPHRWTPFFATVAGRRVVQKDTSKWDYKHQVLEAKRVPAWRVFVWFKAIEVLMQARPRVLARLLLHTDAGIRHAMRWYTRIGRKVWLYEIVEFLFRTNLEKEGPLLSAWIGDSLVEQEYALATKDVPLIGAVRGDPYDPLSPPL